MYVKEQNLIWVATDGTEPIYMIPKMANRHGLIAGATGTGKTVSLKVLAESFSDAGVPVFLVDIKGDVAALCQPGVSNKNVDERVESMQIENFTFSGFPVRFWDVYGKMGIPIRTTISEMGPELLARILDLNDTQSSVLTVVFKIADDNQLLLIDTKDLRSILQYIADHREEFKTSYGMLAPQTLATIQRAVLNLEMIGGDLFFGEPAFDINDWFGLNNDGRGMINLLHSVKLVQNPKLYSTFLLWMLSEIYETLPEVGDLEKPKMVFFFDEAHLLFNNAPKALLEKVEQVVRLIRSKGVGIYFITQQPDDIPDSVLSQLGNKIQHALRAYTPKDQKAVKAAAASFRVNPDFDSEQTLGELGTGEALVSMLDEKGIPAMVKCAFILPPQSSFETIDVAYLQGIIRGDGFYGKYATMVDNLSAFELLETKRMEHETATQQTNAAVETAKQEAIEAKAREKEEALATKAREKEEARLAKEAEKSKQRVTKAVDRVVMSTLSSVGRNVGNSLVRGILGSLKK